MPATVAWAEALDGGDPKANVPQSRQGDDAGRAVHGGAGRSSPSTEWRASQPTWTDAGVLLLTENDRDTRMTRTWVMDHARRHAAQAVRAQPGGFVRQPRYTR